MPANKDYIVVINDVVTEERHFEDNHYGDYLN